MNNKKSFTLIEIVISVSILLIVMAPVSNLFISSIKLANKSNDEMKSAYIAKIIAEELKMEDNLSPVDEKIYPMDNMNINFIKNFSVRYSIKKPNPSEYKNIIVEETNIIRQINYFTIEIYVYKNDKKVYTLHCDKSIIK